MGFIALEGMKFYAYHGFYEEEQIIGTDYIVDVYIETAFGKAANEDALEKTINYETVYLIVKLAMKKKRKLLETITHEIARALKFQFSQMLAVSVRIKKMNPPLGGSTASATVENTLLFKKKCSNCGKNISCYGDESCWCNTASIFPATREMIYYKFNGCLCSNCLQAYEN